MEDAPEETLEAGISPVKVDPFGDAQAQHQIKLWPYCLQQFIRFQHVVAMDKFDVVRKGPDSISLHWGSEWTIQESHRLGKVGLLCITLA